MRLRLRLKAKVGRLKWESRSMRAEVERLMCETEV